MKGLLIFCIFVSLFIFIFDWVYQGESKKKTVQ